MSHVGACNRSKFAGGLSTLHENLIYRPAQIRLDNGARVRVNLFIVHDAAREVALPPKVPGGPAPKRFQWMAVARGQCKKGCQVRQQRFPV